MDSNIWLGLQDGLAHDLFLNHSDLLDGQFHAEVSPGNHQPVGRGDDALHVLEGLRPFDLGDDKGVAAEGFCRQAHGLNIRRTFHEGLAHRVDTVFESEFQAGKIIRGKSADAQVDAWKVEPFPGTQLPTHDNPAADIVFLNPIHLELN
jgi:hypothetical protein